MVVVERSKAARHLGEVTCIAEKEGAHLLGGLHRQGGECVGGLGIAPQARECFLGDAGVQVARTHQHPLQAAARPQRTVVEHVAEGARHRPGVAGLKLDDRQPVGGDAFRFQSAAQESEVLARIQADDAGVLGRRRLSGDDVVLPRGRQQEEAPVFDVDPHARVVERIGPVGEDDAARAEDLARDIDHVDRSQGGRIGQGLRGHAQAVADQQSVARLGP